MLDAVLGACLWSLVALLVAEAKVHHHTWDVAYERKSPHCFEKLAGPDHQRRGARADHPRHTQGDTVVVTVRNKLDQDRGHGHPLSGVDGTAAVTQCPILPGETFAYRFVADRVPFPFKLLLYIHLYVSLTNKQYVCANAKHM